MRKNKRTDIEVITAVYDDIRNNHLGKENAVSRDIFAAAHGLTERDLRAISHEINEREEFSGMVSTSKSLYLCNEKSECIKAIGLTYSAAFALLRKARKMEKKLRENGQFVLTADDRKELMAYWFDREKKGKINETDDLGAKESD